MNRCALLLTTLVAATLAPTLAQAQAHRNFPANALRGELQVTTPPEVLLNGRAAQLAPGARIRGADNLMQLSGALAGQRLLVHYTVDLHGSLLDVWVLNTTERANQPWPVTPQQATGWTFEPAAQRWSK
jgi:hypothetical protein